MNNWNDLIKKASDARKKDPLVIAREKEEISRYSNESDIRRKADKILTFAKKTLKEFTNHTNAILKYKPPYMETVYNSKDCKAIYEIYTKRKFLFFTKKGKELLRIIIGCPGYSWGLGEWSEGSALIINGQIFGNDLPIEKIDENWFKEVIVTEYMKIN